MPDARFQDFRTPSRPEIPVSPENANLLKPRSLLSASLMPARIFRHVLLFFSAGPGFAAAAEFFVSPDGRDDAPGTSLAQPFRTLGRAAAVLQPGDTCWIRAGVYRESVTLTRSGREHQPITFARWQDERVIVDGSDPITGAWTKTREDIWSVPVAADAPIEAVFCEGKMMSEARWPDCAWEDNWVPEKKWALTGQGSALGRIQSSPLARSGLDLSGGLVYLKLSKGNSCHTRPVTRHRAGEATLEYDRAGIEGRAWREDSMPERIKKHGFTSNRFFVVARGALDAPGEWWHDVAAGRLLFISPDGRDPGRLEVTTKARVSGFTGRALSDVVLDGLEFRACNVRFEDVRRVTVRNARFLYPATPRVFPDAETERKHARNLRLAGEFNVVERCLIGWAVDGALEIEGSGNRVEECVVHDSNLHGRHPGPAISVHGSGRGQNVVQRNTIYNSGGVGLYLSGRGSATAGHNHLFNGGLYCVDVSALYVPVGAEMQGTRVHHHWLHDLNGLGFRVDLGGRDITFHHNLVWSASAGCKMQGYQLSGYNNTVLVDEPRSAFIVVFEPAATAADRAGWRLQNNVAYAFLDRLSLRNDPRRGQRPNLRPLSPEPGALDHNVRIAPGAEAELFVDFTNGDFRPRPGGPLDATGLAIPGISGGRRGHPPAIGALEPNEPPWVAGATWLDRDLPVPRSPSAATDLARRLRPASLVVGRHDPDFDQP
jgi:hypothetical protein